MGPGAGSAGFAADDGAADREDLPFLADGVAVLGVDDDFTVIDAQTLGIEIIHQSGPSDADPLASPFIARSHLNG